HLAEEVHLKWIEEFARLLKPGGLLIVTTQPRRFIDFCRQWSEREPELEWHKHLGKLFPNANYAYARFNAGEFIYCPTGGGGVRDSSFYGEAVIPPVYIKKYWTQHLRFREYMEESRISFQAVVTMQKRGSLGARLPRMLSLSSFKAR